MGIHGHGVGTLDSREPFAAALREGEEAAVGGIHVEPGASTLGDVSQTIELIDASGVCAPVPDPEWAPDRKSGALERQVHRRESRDSRVVRDLPVDPGHDHRLIPKDRDVG